MRHVIAHLRAAIADDWIVALIVAVATVTVVRL